MKNEHGFTLLELIVVIVILGILATLGYSQYTRIVERGRAAEAVATIGSMRQLVQEYWLKGGDLATLTNADLGIGLSVDQIPYSCRSTNYFSYGIYNPGGSYIQLDAFRCTSGGKSPNYTGGNRYMIYLNYLPSTGSGTFRCYDLVTSQDISWCVP